MNICLVCREFPPESGISGTGTYMHSIAKCFERFGHKITVISYSRNGESETTDGRMTVYRIRPKNIRGSGRFQRWVPVWYLNYSLAVREKLIQLNRLIGFDIIQIPEWGGEGFFYSLKPFCPFVVKVHGPLFLNHVYDKNSKSNILKYFENWIERYVVKKANAVIFSSTAMKNMTRDIWKINLNNSTIIENPIDLSLFAPKKNQRNSIKRKPIILYVGRLEYRKGIQILIKSLPKVINNHPRTRLLVIGNDTYTGRRGRSILSETNEFLEQHDLLKNVKFIGPQKREILVEYYQNCDLFVMPSLFEPVGFTAIEAMACGKPVIVSSNSGIAERIEDGVSGFLVEPGKIEALSAKINAVLNLNGKERAEIGTSARAAVNELSFDNIGEKLEVLYKKVIDYNNKNINATIF